MARRCVAKRSSVSSSFPAWSGLRSSCRRTTCCQRSRTWSRSCCVWAASLVSDGFWAASAEAARQTNRKSVRIITPPASAAAAAARVPTGPRARRPPSLSRCSSVDRSRSGPRAAGPVTGRSRPHRPARPLRPAQAALGARSAARCACRAATPAQRRARATPAGATQGAPAVAFPASAPGRRGLWPPRRAAPRPAHPGAGQPRAARRPASRLESLHVLLQSLNGVVIMHSRRSWRGPQGRGDVVVFHSVLRPQQKHLALHPGQALEPALQPGFHFRGHRALVRVAVRRANLLVQRYDARPLGAPDGILQHVAADREQPGPELTVAAKPVQGAECPNERLLHHVVHIRFERARAGKEAGQRPGVAAHQFGRRLLVAAPPRGNQRRIGGLDGDGVRLSHVRRIGRREGSREIKAARGGKGRYLPPLAAPYRPSYLPFRTLVRKAMRPY